MTPAEWAALQAAIKAVVAVSPAGGHNDDTSPVDRLVNNDDEMESDDHGSLAND